MLVNTLWMSRLPLRCCELTSTNHGRPQLPQLDERGGARASRRVRRPPQLVQGGLSIGRRCSRCLRWRARWGSSAYSSSSFSNATSTPARSPSGTPASPRLGRTAHWLARSRRCCSRHARPHARTLRRAHAMRTPGIWPSPCARDAHGPPPSAAGGGARGDDRAAAGRHPGARAAAGEATRAPHLALSDP